LRLHGTGKPECHDHHEEQVNFFHTIKILLCFLHFFGSFSNPHFESAKIHFFMIDNDETENPKTENPKLETTSPIIS
jgi:hypothetical protein